MKGLLCDIIEPKWCGNCSNNGISARHKAVVLTGEGIPEIFDPSDDHPEVKLIRNGVNGHFMINKQTGRPERMKAVPVAVEGLWHMFGGCFVYCSDSRFPASAPIHLFDRVEH